MQWYLCIMLFLNVDYIYCSLVTKYYENLISQKISEAEKYELPKNNKEFHIPFESTNITDLGSYDFIIVGAGSAGSVLATRLSEIRKWRILLLEAGDEETDFSLIPRMVFILQFTEKNWGYLSTPQKNCCLGMRNKQCMVPRGKSIGGTSAINGVMYVRGNPEDYNKWVELGNPGWSYKEVLPYFIKSENSQIDGNPDYHGTGGFWNVEYALPASDQFKNFVSGNEEINQTVLDYNGEKQIGISKSQVNIKHGKRQGTGAAFLDNARKRKNLKVITKALVTKININTITKAAAGVEFVTETNTFRATATKEVLISAGAINSPQLLMLSGIGPKAHLEELGIDVIVDLPVGKNLADHPLFSGLVFHTNYTYPDENIETSIEKYLNGYGPLTIPANIDAIGFIPERNSFADVPSTMHMFIPPGASTPSNIQAKIYNYNDELKNQFVSNLNSKTDISFFLLLLHQKSRGRVSLKSNDPTDFPNVDLNLFSEPDDIDSMIEGIEFLLKLSQTRAFQQLNSTLVEIPICQDYEKYTKEFWICVIRHMCMSGYHLTGTTAMGPNKFTSVVDHNLKVHGIDKLRVVDAGVFPSTMSGPTFAPTVMVAEKISDTIKKDYNKINRE